MPIVDLWNQEAWHSRGGRKKTFHTISYQEEDDGGGEEGSQLLSFPTGDGPQKGTIIPIKCHRHSLSVLQ